MQGESVKTTVLRGTGASVGIALGKATILRKRAYALPSRHLELTDIEAELARLDDAIAASKSQLEKLRDSVHDSLGLDNAKIFSAHLGLLTDPSLRSQIEARLRSDLCGIEQACSKVINQIHSQFLSLDNEYMQERAMDIWDIGDRILRNLLGLEAEVLPKAGGEPQILVAEDLSPSETARLDLTNIRAIVTQGGSRMSHSAILARALDIPAVVAVKGVFDEIHEGDDLVLNGKRGTIYVHPSEEIKAEFRQMAAYLREQMRQWMAERDKPAETLDGYQVALVANVELPSETLNLKEKFRTGIGLFRTEFLFVNGGDLLDEEQQFTTYRDTARAVFPYSVIFRTLDVGGDKLLSQVDAGQEPNPFMGMRAIRFSLNHIDSLRIQLRAILRASAEGKVRVMFPMISTLDELQRALEVLKDVKAELKAKGIPYNDDLDVGCMIEVPSAALIANKLMPLVDFFSLGTNDLTQYSLAVDRANPDVEYLYQPCHPSVIRMMKQVADVCYEHGKWLSVCGEMAADPLFMPLALGMGIHELSMSPVALPSMQKLVRSIRMHEAEELVRRAIDCGSANEVLVLCRQFLEKACPELL